MLKKENRINKNKDFDRIFKTGQSFYGRTLGIKAVKNNLSLNRFGIMISTKVSKKAVVRNRFKRQLREIIKNELEFLKTGYDLVIIVFPLILDKKYQKLEDLLRIGLRSLKLYK